ncbi:MAG: hypothetical protein M3209_03970 [Acidobacteriota bacterium]|nr:hypothetical protein [Acidobacteriota bacterium]
MTSPKKYRTEITIETHNVTIIRTRGKKLWAECQHCRKKSEAVTVQHSAALLNTTPLNVYSLIQMGELHFLRIAESGTLPLVCGSSLGENHLPILDSLLKL